MKLSLTASGLLDPKRLDRWLPDTRRAVRQSIEAVFKTCGREMAESARSKMQSVFRVHKGNFLKSMRHKILPGDSRKLPALLIGSRIPWLGLHMRGGTIHRKMLIPLLPEHRRIGRKAFRRVIDGLMQSGNAFFIERNGKVILMAENLKENTSHLRRFKRAERQRTGAKSIKRGQSIPIAVLVPRVTLRARFDLPGLVVKQLPRISAALLKQLSAHGL